MNQQVVQGVSCLPQLIEKTGCKKLLIVGGSSLRHPAICEVLDTLTVDKALFSGYSANPLYEQVCEGVVFFRQEQCDGILAIGGGSPIDVAKCIKLSILSSEGTASLILPLVSICAPVNDAKLPLIAIPTTAGTGSESTHNAVIYYQGSKQTVTHDCMLPDYAILDAALLDTLPLYQKKCTLMDAFSQAIESWWSVHSTEQSKQYSKVAIELIMKNWEDYIFQSSKEAAKQILLASNYAGRAINITATTAAHAMSYKITTITGLPHGHAVASCLPFIWQYMEGHLEETIDPRGSEYLSSVFLQISRAMGCESIFEAICQVTQMMQKMDLHQPVIHGEDDLAILATSVNPVRLKNNPVLLSEAVLRNLYCQITGQNIL